MSSSTLSNQDGGSQNSYLEFNLVGKIYRSTQKLEWLVAKGDSTYWIKPILGETNGFWVHSWKGESRRFPTLESAIGFALQS